MLTVKKNNTICQCDTLHKRVNAFVCGSSNDDITLCVGQSHTHQEHRMEMLIHIGCYSVVIKINVWKCLQFVPSFQKCCWQVRCLEDEFCVRFWWFLLDNTCV